MDEENQRALLQVEWENFRYQDKLRWSRVQTVGVIEAALLAGMYSNTPGVNAFMRFIFVLIMSFIVLSFCLLAEKDGRDSWTHAGRAELLEKSLGLPERVTAKRVLGIRGHHTLQAAMVLLTILNILILADAARRAFGPLFIVVV